MLARCRGAFFLLLLPLFCLSSGCRNKTDLVESQLRTKEIMYREAMEEQRRTEAQIIAMHREIEALRQGAKVTPEQAAQTFGLKRIVLGRATGAFDHDNLPGDEVLQVVVEPRDESDHAIKSPGSLQIFTLEITPQGVKTPLFSWEVGPEQLRRTWKQGLLSTGYTLTLPWKNPPTTEQVRVIVRFITADQRRYEAEKDIKVRLLPGAAQRRLEMIPDASPLPAPSQEMGPILVPTSKTTTAYRPAPLTQWHPIAPTSTQRD